MDSSSDNDSWSTVESSLWLDSDSGSEIDCSTCTTSDDEDCSYKREQAQGRPLGDRTNTAAAVKRPQFARGKKFVLKTKAENDLEEAFTLSEDEDDFPGRDAFSSTSYSSGSDEEEAHTEKWTATDTRKTFPFTATPVINSGTAETPLDFFYLLFNEDFIQFLVDNINARGQEFAKQRKKVFTPTDADEMYTLLCTHFMMGFTGCIAKNILFGQRPSLNIDFNTYVRKERYILLFHLLTYRDIKTESREAYRSWYEVAKPFADKFNVVMKTLMVPGKDLNLEKQTVLYFNDKNVFLRRPERIRLHLLADDNGIFQRVFLVDPVLQEEVRGETIAKALMEDFMDSGYSLFVSNMFYPSIPLAEEFLKRKTYLTGVLKKNKPRNPAFLKLKPGSSKMPVRKFKRVLPEDNKNKDDKKSGDKKNKDDKKSDDNKKIDDKKSKVLNKEVTIVHGFNKQGVCVCKIIRPHMKFNMISTEFCAKPAVDDKWECEMLEQIFKHTNTMRRDSQLSKCGPQLQRKNNRHVVYMIQAMCINAYLMYKAKTGKRVKFVNFLEEILYQMLPLEATNKNKENAAGRNKRPRRNRRGEEGPDDCVLT